MRQKEEALIIQQALTDEEVRKRLQLTADELQVLDDIIKMKRRKRTRFEPDPYRHVGAQLQAIRLKIEATVRPPEQTIKGEMAVQVVVNTLRRAEEQRYELPAGATVTEPEKLDA